VGGGEQRLQPRGHGGVDPDAVDRHDRAAVDARSRSERVERAPGLLDRAVHVGLQRRHRLLQLQARGGHRVEGAAVGVPRPLGGLQRAAGGGGVVGGPRLVGPGGLELLGGDGPCHLEVVADEGVVVGLHREQHLGGQVLVGDRSAAEHPRHAVGVRRPHVGGDRHLRHLAAVLGQLAGAGTGATPGGRGALGGLVLHEPCHRGGLARRADLRVEPPERAGQHLLGRAQAVHLRGQLVEQDADGHHPLPRVVGQLGRGPVDEVGVERVAVVPERAEVDAVDVGERALGALGLRLLGGGIDDRVRGRGAVGPDRGLLRPRGSGQHRRGEDRRGEGGEEAMAGGRGHGDRREHRRIEVVDLSGAGDQRGFRSARCTLVQTRRSSPEPWRSATCGCWDQRSFGQTISP